MHVEIVKVSSKGQLVIPKETRDEMGIEEGTAFALAVRGDTIVLKRMLPPTEEQFWKDWETMGKEGKKRLQKKGLTERDIPDLIEKHRKRRF